MTRDKREFLAGYVDGELSDSELREFEEELAVNSELKAELDELMKLKQLTSQMSYADLPEEVWDNYWSSLYKKLERGFGWIFFSFGAILLLSFGVYEFFKELLFDPEVPIIIKIGASTLSVGGVILLVSFIRERLFAYNNDRYREVTR